MFYTHSLTHSFESPSVNDDSKSSASVDKEEEKRQKHPENYDQRNKLKMGKFHRYAIEKPKKRAVPNKKKIRDLERLLEKKGDTMPEEVKKAKKKELKELKRGEKHKKEAELFETRYKKIKFFEKRSIFLERSCPPKQTYFHKMPNRILNFHSILEFQRFLQLQQNANMNFAFGKVDLKIIRKLEKLDKEKKQEGLDEEKVKELDQTKEKYRNYLTYVNNFPPTKKYISLFPTSETDKSEDQRDLMMTKILKMVEVKNKIRDKELIDMDKEEAMIPKEEYEQKVEKKVKQLAKQDDFFTTDEVIVPTQAEKKIVQRNGYLAAPLKTQEFRKQQKIEQEFGNARLAFKDQGKREWKPRPQEAEQKKKQEPIKINPNSYRVKAGATQDTQQKTHIKF